MNHQFPIYTVDNECQDCYKCVRHCPVKAISVTDNHARVVPELCISCGNCAQICPATAKRVRNDISRAKSLIERREAVYVSLAPSWVTEFPGLSASMMIGALRQLGFAGVSETALGAQEITTAIASMLKDEEAGLFVTSACPASTEFVRKYLPEYADDIMPLRSPALAHAAMLRQAFGEDIGVVMISPCIAKKCEADADDGLDLALTFTELREWLKHERIDPKFAVGDHDFELRRSEEGALYPIEGGLLDTVRLHLGAENVQGIALSGIQQIDKALARLNMGDVEDVILLELLACEGGCVNGPCMDHQDAGLVSRIQVLKNTQMPGPAFTRKLSVDVSASFPATPVVEAGVQEPEIREALVRVGKRNMADELNCGGCGYSSCREFAKALIQQKAEPAMCVSYLRKQAQKKANALLRSMPSGVVIVDADLRIVECNRRFAEMFDEVTACAFEAKPGMGGAALSKILSFGNLFRTVLETGEDLRRSSLRVDERLLDITIFSIEPKQTAGAVISDVTQAHMRREQIARRAGEVIQKNLATVQEVACMLGEHMADTEILLRDIADDYAC